MPRKAKYTKDALVREAVQLVREDGYSCLSARNLTKRLGATQATIFTHYDSMDLLKDDVNTAMRSIYESYIKEGLATDLPFKGFALAILRFVKDEPNFYRAIFFGPKQNYDLDGAIHAEGHCELAVQSAMKTFELTHEEGTAVYRALMLVEVGLAGFAIANPEGFDLEKAGAMLSFFAKAIVSDVKANGLKNFNRMPKAGAIPSVDEWATQR